MKTLRILTAVLIAAFTLNIVPAAAQALPETVVLTTTATIDGSYDPYSTGNSGGQTQILQFGSRIGMFRFDNLPECPDGYYLAYAETVLTLVNPGWLPNEQLVQDLPFVYSSISPSEYWSYAQLAATPGAFVNEQKRYFFTQNAQDKISLQGWALLDHYQEIYAGRRKNRPWYFLSVQGFVNFWSVESAISGGTPAKLVLTFKLK